VDEVAILLDKYSRWIKDKTILKRVDDKWAEINTPFLDRHNDYLQIYVGKENGSLILTDDAYTINDLISSGCTLDTPKRQELLKMTLAGFGVNLAENQSIFVHATHNNFPSKKHNLVQAMLAVNDMFFLAMPYTASLFMEDGKDKNNFDDEE
jgi:hypothetical protein